LSAAEGIPQHVLQRTHPGDENLAGFELAGMNDVRANALKKK
jgi:hypothetical protein